MENDIESTTDRMRADWNARAVENARHYIATYKDHWDDAEFLESGRTTVQEEILSDMANICQGRNPKEMRVLEIGCGAGRITHALAQVFGEVIAVDISDEMIRQAKITLKDTPNAHVYVNNGRDLSVLPPVEFDFAYSYIVFQHIPSMAVIESYVREVRRVLRPGSLFKFQVLSGPTDALDTWTGHSFSEEEALELALRCGFEPRYMVGAGRQYFWLWFFHSPAELARYVGTAKKYALSLRRTCDAVQIVPEMGAADAACFRLHRKHQRQVAGEYDAATRALELFLDRGYPESGT